MSTVKATMPLLYYLCKQHYEVAPYHRIVHFFEQADPSNQTQASASSPYQDN